MVGQYLINNIMKYILEEEVIIIIKRYINKGKRCMKQSAKQKDIETYTFWDGFHNCAENILKEIKDIK